MADDHIQQELGDHLGEALRKNVLSRRQFLVRASVLGLGATAAGRILAACGGTSSGGTSSASAAATTSAAPAPKAGGTMRVVMVGPTAALDPVIMYDGGSTGVVQQICEYLCWTENDLSLRPVLAESWTPNATADTWTFKLRQGATFNDGQPLTADDVVATMKLLCDPNGGSAALTNFQGVLVPDGLRAVDASTVEFGLEVPFVDFPYLVSSSNYNAVILPASYKGDFEKNPVGTGPFLLETYDQRQGATFKKNPTYWQKDKGLPYLDGVAMTFNPDMQAQVVFFQAGDADMMLQSPVQGTQSLSAASDVKIGVVPSTRTTVYHMRVDKEPFTSKEVQQAIAYCLARPDYLQGLFAGDGLDGNDSFFSTMYPTSPQDLTRQQDYAKAKELLSAAGYADGVEVTLVVEQYMEEVQAAQMMQQQCKGGGVDMKVQPMSQTEYYGSGDNQPWLTVPMGSTQWAMRPVPEQFYQPCLYSDGVWNSAHFKNSQFDSLGKQYTSTLDEGTRKDLARQLTTLQMDETPLLIPYWIPARRAMKKNVYNVLPDGSDFLDLTTAYFG
jgi:peptide/nickel transport system substrate-binding protein